MIIELQKFGFCETFIKWIQILLRNQESCIINGETTTKYFKFEKGTRKGHPIVAYLLILVLKIAFVYIKENKNIKGINTFSSVILYSAYANDKCFVIQEYSVIEEMKSFDKFSLLSGLKLNKTKCEMASIGILKGVLLALCGMDCIDLTKTAIQILGMHYKKKLETEENFIKHVQKIEKVLKLWRMWNLNVEGKITVFKTLVIFRIIHFFLVTIVPMEIINELSKIQKEFIWNGNNPKT